MLITNMYRHIYKIFTFYQGYSTKVAAGVYPARGRRGFRAMQRAEISVSELRENRSLSVDIETGLFGGQILTVPARL